MPGCTRRATSSTTRHKSGAQTVSHLRFGPQPIHAPYLIQHASFVACHQFQLRRARTTCCGWRRPARRCPAQQPVWRRTRSGSTCRARCSSASSTTGCGSSSSTPRASAQDVGLRGPHQHHPADLLLRHLRRAAARTRRSRQIKEAIRKSLRRARATTVVQRELPRRRRRRWRACSRSRCRPRPPAPASARPPCRPTRPRSCAQVTAAHDGGPRRRDPGQPDAGRRHLPLRHGGLGEAQHRRRRAGLGAGPLHPVRPVQLRLPARRDPRQVLRRGPAGRRAGRLPLGADQRARLSRRALHPASSRSRIAPAAACASRPARRTARRAGHQGDQPARQAAAARAGARRASRSSTRCR